MQPESYIEDASALPTNDEDEYKRREKSESRRSPTGKAPEKRKGQEARHATGCAVTGGQRERGTALAGGLRPKPFAQKTNPHRDHTVGG